MQRKKVNTKTLVICIMVVLLIANVTAGLTGAFFTSNDNDSVSSNFGIIELGDLGEVPIKMIKGEVSLDVLMPGDKIDVNFKVSNAGTADMLVRYKLVAEGSGAGAVTTADNPPSNYTMVDFDSLSGGLNTGTPDLWVVRNTAFTDESGEVDDISMTFTISTALGNTFFSKTVNFSLVVQAVQAANMPGFVEGDYTTIEDWDLNSIAWPVYEGAGGITPLAGNPKLNGVNNLFIEKGISVNFLEGVSAYDNQEGDLTDNIIVNSQEIDLNTEGDYTVEYSVTDSEGNTTSKEVMVIVYSSDGQEPMLGGASVINTLLGESIDLKSFVIAYDVQDGELTDSIQVNAEDFDFNAVGDYVVEYSVTDSDENTATKTVLVRVMDENSLENVYLIKNVTQLNYFANKINEDSSYSSNKTFKLDNNIDLDGVNWTPIGSENNSFVGEFDGNGYTISNLTTGGIEVMSFARSANSSATGFFGEVGANSYIHDVTFDNVNINGDELTGVVAGYAWGDATGIAKIENINILSGTVNGQNLTGGIVGLLEGGSIKNVTNNASVIGIDNVGGIAGEISNEFLEEDFTLSVENLTNNGDVTGNYTVYGLSGKSDVEVIDGINQGIVTSNDVWTNFAVEPEGEGSESNPYKITSAEKLAWIAEQVNVYDNRFENEYIVLTNDIDLSYHCWYPIGHQSVFIFIIGGDKNIFNGNFDGRGYSVNNLRISSQYSDLKYSVGLFGGVENATIENLTLNNFNIYINNEDDRSCVGSLAGAAKRSTINNIEVNSSNISAQNSINVGGIIGYLNYNSYVSNLTTNEDVSVLGNSTVGGVIGSIISIDTLNRELSINAKNLVNKGSVEGNRTVGGIAGYLSRTEVDNLYNEGSVKGDNIVGGVCGGLYFAVASNSANNGTVVGNENTGDIMGYYNFEELSESEEPYVDSSTGAYKIYSIKNFLWIKEQVENDPDWATDKKFVLISDVDFTRYIWEPIGTQDYPFKGHFDGNGYTIYGLSMWSEYSSLNKNIGLFGYVQNATIQNFNMQAVSIVNTGGGYVGAVAGYAKNSTFNNITIESGMIKAIKDDSFGSNAIYVGGVVGFSFSNVSGDNHDNLINYATVQGYSYVGGIAGMAFYTTFKDLTNYGNISGNSMIGGVVGTSKSSTLEDFVNEGNVTGETNVGGIVGSTQEDTIKNCDVDGATIIGETNVGGITGYINKGEVSSCTVTNDVTITGSSKVGGIIGNNYGNFADCIDNINNSNITNDVG